MKNHWYFLFVLIAFIPSVGECNLVVSSHDDTRSYTPFMEAAKACELDKVQSELRQNPLLLKSTEMDGATALHDAVSQNCLAVTKYLLDSGLDVNVVDEDDNTPLHLAARNGNIEIISLLLERKADINALDSQGRTPLDRAQKRNHIQAVEILQQHGGQEGRQ